MRKILFVLLIALSYVALFSWSVGDVISEDYSWTDNNGEEHSIHELTESGKAVVIFWGEDW